MSNAIETAMFLRRYQSWRKGEIDVFYPDSHAGPNPVEISAAIDRAIVALEAQPPCGADGAVTRCALCEYQYGHAIGCKNNPVDIALLASQPAAPVAPIHHAMKESPVVQSNNSLSPLKSRIQHSGVVMLDTNECPMCKRYNHAE